MNFLDKLRQKDSASQDSFTFLVSLGLTAFIFTIWVLSMAYGFVGQSEINTASPIEIFSEKLKSSFSGKETYNADK